MMPVQEMTSQSSSQSPVSSQQPTLSAGEHVNYKKKYKALKRKMKMLVYEQECFNEELKRAQRKLLKVSRDRNFLLDRLLNYEQLEDSSDDTDATASSDSDAETREPMMKKKKVPNKTPLSLSSAGINVIPGNLSKQQASWLMQMSNAADKVGKSDGTAKKKKGSKKSAKSASQDSGVGSSSSATGHMTREELERHLELKQSAKPQYMSVEKTPYSLPDDIFCNDNSNQDGESPEVKKEEFSLLNQFHNMPR